MVIVKRFKEIEKLKKLNQPLLVYGRRKTGKTHLIKSFFPDLPYFFVKRDGGIFHEKRKETINYKELIRIIEESKTKIIIDEFHRLPDEFLDYLHMKSFKHIILVTSTLFLAKNLLGKRSPILGLFLDFKVDLIDELDILKNLFKIIKNKKSLVKNCTYLREPLLLRFFDNKNFFNVLKNMKIIVPSLVGEIFIEEERELTSRYEAILRAIASGKGTLTEIASLLFSNKIIEKQDISAIKPYIKNLIEIGLVKRIPEHIGKRNYYYIHSPLIDLYYYLDEKYNFSENDIEEDYMNTRIPFHIEHFFRDLLSKHFKMRLLIVNKPNLEIDIALAEFKKIKIVCEVKWKIKIKFSELKDIEIKLNKFKDCRKILIVPDKNLIKEKLKDIEIKDIMDFVPKTKK